jgi:hypothetical protein
MTKNLEMSSESRASDDRERVLSRRARFVALALASVGLAGATDAGPADATSDVAQRSPDAGGPVRPRPGIGSALEAARDGQALAVQAALEAARPLELLEFPEAVAELELECSRSGDIACQLALLVARHAALEGRVAESERAALLDRIGELRPKVARLELEVPTDAGEVVVNGVSFGSASGRRVAWVAPGRYRIVQLSPIGEEAGRVVHHVELAANGAATVRLESLSTAPMVCLSPPPPPPAERPRGCGCDVVGRG